ncbi:hypothetical protein BDP27DRAFT_1323425 [Rhodocollybia butyracea]|uniref:Uncharacterized protein n=1 Tax=Rhodocollybia butyracea TaxID=206335 RepID=A0A9P5U906_9AGAR|nr:hypothetical protein BDP27DRAFT_1323425 [Rhodocollybia butyracea]
MVKVKKSLTAGSVHTLLYSTPKDSFSSFSMLITPYIHYFGLVSIAALVSVVHAMPTPLVAPSLPVIDITVRSPVKHLDKKLVGRNEGTAAWNALVRITVLDEEDLTRIYDGTFTTGTRGLITEIINRALADRHYEPKDLRYMNELHAKKRGTKDSIFFVVETQNGRCSGTWPCVGRRKKNTRKGVPAWKSFYQINDHTKDVPTRIRLEGDDHDWEWVEVEPEFKGSFSQKFRAGWSKLKGKIEKVNDEQNRILKAAEEAAEAARKQKKKKNTRKPDQGGRSPKKQRVEGGGLDEQASGATTSVTLSSPPEGLQQNPNSRHPGGNSENKKGEHGSQAPGVTTPVTPSSPPPGNVVSESRHEMAVQSSTEPPKLSVAWLLNPILSEKT